MYSLMMFLISGSGMWRSFSRLMLLVWIAFLTPAMMTIRGSTCHTCALIVSINGLYVFFLFVYFVQCVYHG